jgi:calcium homeostasis ER protein
MVPLVQLEEHNYKSIDPSLVRLPAPQPPSERLLSAIEEFYEPATEDKPRNE